MRSQQVLLQVGGLPTPTVLAPFFFFFDREPRS